MILNQRNCRALTALLMALMLMFSCCAQALAELDDTPPLQDAQEENAIDEYPVDAPPVSFDPDATPAPAATPVPYNPERPGMLRDIDLEGESCILVDRADGAVLYEKDAHSKRYPASTTKVMTMLLAVEYGHFDEIIEIAEEAEKVPSDSSKTPVLPGERMSFRALLYGMMLPSGNDSSNAVAMIVSGSLDAFVERMNERARELGCTGTNFVNAHGYHNEEHYTTAADMAKIAAEGMKHEEFRKIVATPYYTLPATLYRAQGLDITNHNLMLLGSSEFYYAPIRGIKTGFHNAAGQCFVAAGDQASANLISVTFKTSNEGRWHDTRRLMEYGFNQYRDYTFEELYKEHPLDVVVTGADPQDIDGGRLALDIVPGGELNSYAMNLREGAGADRVNFIITNSELTYTHTLNAPIRAGEKIATLTAKYADGRTLSSDFVASRNVAPAPAAIPETPVEEVEPTRTLDSDGLRLLLIAGGILLLTGVAAFFIIRVRRERERKRKLALRKKRAAQRRAQG